MIEHLWWLLLFSIIPSCLSKVKVSPITRTWLSTFTWKLWLSFVFLTELNGWAFVYEISGCGIDYCYSYVNFRYRAYFEQGAPWYPDNYRVYIHSKTWLWHDKKNTQLKNFLPLYRFSMVKQLKSHLARIGSKRFLFIRSEKYFLSFIFTW